MTRTSIGVRAALIAGNSVRSIATGATAFRMDASAWVTVCFPPSSALPGLRQEQTVLPKAFIALTN